MCFNKVVINVLLVFCTISSAIYFSHPAALAVPLPPFGVGLQLEAPHAHHQVFAPTTKPRVGMKFRYAAWQPLAHPHHQFFNATAIGTTEFAGIEVTNNVAEHYYGASASMNIYEPIVQTEDQYSASAIFLGTGDGDDVRNNLIEAGWAVNPKLNGDHKVRLYVKWKSDEEQGECYNTQCPGYVHSNPTIPINFEFPNHSTQDNKFDVKITLRQVMPNGEWRLEVDDQVLGYWPASGLSKLQNGADYIRFGGEVFSPSDKSPQMGNGEYHGGNKPKTCFMRNLLVFNHPNQTVPASPDASSSTTVHEKDHRCYYGGVQPYDEPSGDGFSFIFGGTGDVGRRNVCLS